MSLHNALEFEAIEIILEAVVGALLHLARKAFWPAPPPFPLLHVEPPGSFRRCMHTVRAWSRRLVWN